MLFRPLTSVAALLLLTSPGTVIADYQYNLLDAFYHYALEYEYSQHEAAENSQSNYGTEGFSYLQDLQHGNSPSSEELSSHSTLLNDLAVMLNAPTRKDLYFPGQPSFNAYIDNIVYEVCPGYFSCQNRNYTHENSTIHRTITGICNNLENPLYGSAFSVQPSFKKLRGSWERMGLVNYELTEAGVLFDTKYIGVTPVFDERPFLVKVQGNSTLRISLYNEKDVEKTENVTCNGICTVEGAIMSVKIIRNDGNCKMFYKPRTNTFRVEGSDCPTKTFSVNFYPFIADIRLQPNSGSTDSTLSNGTEIDSSSKNKFSIDEISRYWIKLQDNFEILISAGTEFSDDDVFLKGETVPFDKLRRVFVVIGTEGSNLITEFAIRDVYEVATDDSEGAYPSYGFINNLNHLSFLYNFYTLRFGVRQNKEGQLNLTMIGTDGSTVALIVDNIHPEFSTLTGTSSILPVYNFYNLEHSARVDFETAAGARYNNYDAMWLAWYNNFIYFGTGNQIARNMVTDSPLMLTELAGSFEIAEVILSSQEYTEWVFDIEQINKPRVSSLHTGESLPSALDVALELLTEKGETKWSNDVTLMTFQWGQFLDHDLIATPLLSVNGHAPSCCSGGQPVSDASYSEEACFNIPVNNDVLAAEDLLPFDASTTQCLNFVRSANILDCSTPSYEVDDRLRHPMNIITSWLDASNVYESRVNNSEELRDEHSAKMKVLANPHDDQLELPLATEAGEACAVNGVEIDGTTISCRVGGDFRSGEQMTLNGMHTLFVREHNRLVDVFKDQLNFTDNTTETREELFQIVRHIVAAEMQVITYKNFLPSFLGTKSSSKYKLDYDQECKYDPELDASIRNLWGIIFRMGHDWIPNNLVGNPDDPKIFENAIDSLPLVNNFFNFTTSFYEGGTNHVMLNLHKACPLTDGKMESTVEFHLFGNLEGDLDGTFTHGSLGALNIQRGRDHGVETYNGIRDIFELSQPENIDELFESGSVSAETYQSLKLLYHGIDDIDAFLGGMMELPDPNDDALSGDIINNVLGEMFKLLKRGDRFWYTCYFTDEAIKELQKVTVGRIMCDNIEGFDTEDTQEDLFMVYNSTNNVYVDCAKRPQMDYSVFSTNGGRRPGFGTPGGSTERDIDTELNLMEKLLEDVDEMEELRAEDKK